MKIFKIPFDAFKVGERNVAPNDADPAVDFVYIKGDAGEEEIVYQTKSQGSTIISESLNMVNYRQKPGMSGLIEVSNSRHVIPDFWERLVEACRNYIRTGENSGDL